MRSKKLMRMGLITIAVMLSGLTVGALYLFSGAMATPPKVCLGIALFAIAVVFASASRAFVRGFAALRRGELLPTPLHAAGTPANHRLTKLILIGLLQGLLLVGGVYFLGHHRLALSMISMGAALLLALTRRYWMRAPEAGGENRSASSARHGTRLQAVNATLLIFTPTFAVPVCAVLGAYHYSFGDSRALAEILAIGALLMFPIIFWTTGRVSREFGIPDDLNRS